MQKLLTLAALALVLYIVADLGVSVSKAANNIEARQARIAEVR